MKRYSIDQIDKAWVERYSLKRYVLKFQQKVDTVWSYQVKSKKLQTSWHRLFFNSFIVTNWRQLQHQ